VFAFWEERLFISASGRIRHFFAFFSQNRSSATMSGLGNFGLNSLGNMSTLGSLAQSAQRLDRLMAGNRARQEDNYGRNNNRRLMDDDFFGGRSSDRGRRRSPSPPRVNIEVDLGL
jgi:hypothetical protein